MLLLSSSHIWRDHVINQSHPAVSPESLHHEATMRLNFGGSPKPIQANSNQFSETNSSDAKKNNPAKFCATGVRDPSEVNLKPISIKMRKSICWQPEDVAEDWYCEHASSVKGKLCDVKRSTVVEDVVDRFSRWLMYLKISEACLIPRRWWGSEKGKWCDAKSRRWFGEGVAPHGGHLVGWGKVQQIVGSFF